MKIDSCPNPEDFTTRQLAGQRLMAGFDGVDLNDELRRLIDEVKIAGIVLFARNIENPKQLERLCANAQKYALSAGQPPLLIAIDQEGGQVARLKPPFTQFPGNPAIQSVDQARDFASVCARELLEIGINMNLAPVLDVMPENGPSVMEKRVFSHDPAKTALLGCQVIKTFQSNGLMAVAKHFPGIGRTVLDSHESMPDLDTSGHELKKTDWVPFLAAIKKNVSGVMLSHIRYVDLDPVWPAGFSRIIAHDLLRMDMGFEGVSMTDDLYMGAVSNHFDAKTTVDRALEARVDLFLFCRPGKEIHLALNQIQNACESREVLKQNGKESVKRILDLKKSYLYNGKKGLLC